MGYKMEYGSWNRQTVYRRIGGKKRLYISILLTVALIIGYLQRERIVNFLLPGDPEATKKAISVFVHELKDGESVEKAFGSFCKVILDEAELS